MHDVSLIVTIAAALTAAWAFGLVTQRLGLSPVVGYLLAGILIGPHTPGFVGDGHIAQLAEVGVILLMFGVGLHFHLKDLLAVKGVAIPGALGQSAVATIAAILIFQQFGMPIATGAVIGMAMAVASTVVLMRVLMDADALNTRQGHVAVGWLIVEDILTVILLVIIPVLGTSVATTGSEGPVASVVESAVESAPASIWMTLLIALLKLAALVLIVLFAGSRIVPWVLVRVARLRSRELFTLTVLVIAMAIATGSYLFFGASMALGAFLAGMVVAQSPVSHQAAADALPMRDAFAVLFFVSVGMVFNPAFLVEEPWMLLAGLGIILIIKPLIALLIVALLGHTGTTALTVAVGLAQIGEFSFILSDLGRRNGLMTDTGHNLLVACAIVSITLNPLLFRSLPRMEAFLRQRPTLWNLLNGRAERRIAAQQQASRHGEAADAGSADERRAIVVGFGPVGRTVYHLFADAGLRTTVIDANLDTVQSLNAAGNRAVYGDASHEGILEHAGIRDASHVIVTLPNDADRAAVVTAARHLNPRAQILVRARYLRERHDLEMAGATAAVFEEAEAAVALARLALTSTGLGGNATERKINELRVQFIRENVTEIRSRRVASVMIPWARVKWLASDAPRDAVIAAVASEGFSRFPVMDRATSRASQYLLAKDLIARGGESDWKKLLRPLHAIAPSASVDATLGLMQDQRASMYVVEEAGRPIGLVTLEDVLEQVVGRIEDEYPRDAELSLAAALIGDGVPLELTATARDAAIRELALTVPPERWPAGIDAESIVRLAMEREAVLSTDLGNGMWIPHARCPGMTTSLVIIGRSSEGLDAVAGQSARIRLVVLLVTPAERPAEHIGLLAQIARKLGTDDARQQLLRGGAARLLIASRIES